MFMIPALPKLEGIKMNQFPEVNFETQTFSLD